MPTARIPSNDADAQIAAWQAKGLGITSNGVKLGAPEAEAPKTRKKDLLPTCFVPPNAFLLGLQTLSANQTLASGRREVMRRKVEQREAILALFAIHWQIVGPWGEAARAGKPVLVKFARLGGRKVDRHENLPMCFKHILDSVCAAAGIDDGIDNLKVEYDQFDNERIGVRIILEVCE